MKMNNPLEHQFDGFDNRLILNSLASVKYFLVGQNDSVPEIAGYMEKSDKVAGDGMILYQNPYVLPFAYLYEDMISVERYNEMNVEQKQEALLYGAVVEESNLPQAEIPFSSKEITYDITLTDGVSQEGEKFKVVQSGGQVILRLDEIPECSEVYVLVEGMQYEGIRPGDQWANGDLDNAGWHLRQVLRRGERTYQEKDNVSIQVMMGERQKGINYFCPNHRMYCGKHDFFCNMGYTDNGTDEVIIDFSDVGFYSFDNIRVVVQPMDQVYQQLGKMRNEEVKTIEVLTNNITVEANCSKESLLCVSVPYSTGWNVMVDGVKQDVKQVNSIFMGVELGEGSHEVSFTYHVPQGKEGLVLSIAGVIGLLFCAVMYEKRRYVESGN